MDRHPPLSTGSVVTFELVIGLATSRLFARLPPGSVQSAVAPGAADWTLFDKQLAAAGLPTPPHRRQPGPAATTSVTLAAVDRVAKHLI
jgi:hypothetical protein